MDTDKHGFLFKEETHQIIGCVFEVLNTLGHGFVQGQRQRQDLGAGVGNLQLLKNGGDLCLARIAKMAFSDIEADIGLIIAHGIDDAVIGFQEISLVPAFTDGIDQGQYC